MSFLQRFSSNKVVTLEDAPTIVIDLSLGPHCMVTLIGDRTLGNPINVSAAKEFWTAVRQDGIGGRTLSFDTDWVAIDPTITINPDAESVSLVFAVGRDFGAGLKWYYTVIQEAEAASGGTVLDILVDPLATPDDISVFANIETMYAATVTLPGLKRVTLTESIEITATDLDLNKYAFIGIFGGFQRSEITLHGTMLTPPRLLKNIKLTAGTDLTPCLTLTDNAVTRLEDSVITYGSSGGFCVLDDFEYDIYLYGDSHIGNQLTFIMSGNSYLYLETHNTAAIGSFISGSGGTLEHKNYSPFLNLDNQISWSGGTSIFLNNIELASPSGNYQNVTVNDTPYIFSYTPNLKFYDSVFTFKAKVLGINAAAGDVASYELLGLFYINGSGVVSQKGTTTVVHSYEDDAAWNCTLATNGTLLEVTVTGGAGVDVSWRLYGSITYHETVPAGA
jgi:hypothetical protein